MLEVAADGRTRYGRRGRWVPRAGRTRGRREPLRGEEGRPAAATRGTEGWSPGDALGDGREAGHTLGREGAYVRREVGGGDYFWGRVTFFK